MRHLVYGLGTESVDKEDYLKVVEENEKLGKSFDMMRNEYDIKVRQLKEKDEELEKLKYNSNRLENLTHFIYQNFKGYAGWDTVEAVKDILGENEQELWTLKYIYDVDGVVKEYEQNGMIKEDAEELIGMDSDNWNHYSLTKEERPDKDKIIEGLLIRCESNEELIKELEERLIETNKAKEKYKELYYNSQRLDLNDRRA